MILFLDLEDTIIESFTDFSYHARFVDSNIEKIKQHADFKLCTEIVIFSYAIDNDMQKLMFLERNKTLIENKIGLPISYCFTIKDMIQITNKEMSLEFKDLWHICRVLTKQMVFSKCVNSMDSFNKKDIIYFDDIVKDESYVNTYGAVRNIINVEKL